MLDNKNLWYLMGASLFVIYGAGLYFLLAGQPGHLFVRLSAIILVAHALEIPLALKKVRERQPSVPRVAALTLVFGLVYWVPASRGVFPVR